MTVPIGRYDPYPNPGPKWEPDDWREAEKLGWFIDPSYTICAVPSGAGPAGRLHFRYDSSAAAFVGALALKGHPLARRALEYVAMKTGVDATAEYIMSKEEGK